MLPDPADRATGRGMADRLRAEHRAIVRAIDGGRTDVAAALVRDHITGYYAATGSPPTARTP